MNVFANPIIAQVISICVAGICGWLAAQVRDMRKKEEALHDGMKVLLRSQVYQAYERHVANREPISYEQMEMANQAFEAYRALGGNGVATGLHAEVMALSVSTPK